MRTVWWPGPLERSAVQRQLSTMRSGQFRLAQESPTRAAARQRQRQSPCMVEERTPRLCAAHGKFRAQPAARAARCPPRLLHRPAAGSAAPGQAAAPALAVAGPGGPAAGHAQQEPRRRPPAHRNKTPPGGERASHRGRGALPPADVSATRPQPGSATSPGQRPRAERASRAAAHSVRAWRGSLPSGPHLARGRAWAGAAQGEPPGAVTA